jgi:hypothetical protein
VNKLLEEWRPEFLAAPLWKRIIYSLFAWPGGDPNVTISFRRGLGGSSQLQRKVAGKEGQITSGLLLLNHRVIYDDRRLSRGEALDAFFRLSVVGNNAPGAVQFHPNEESLADNAVARVCMPIGG